MSLGRPTAQLWALTHTDLNGQDVSMALWAVAKANLIVAGLPERFLERAGQLAGQQALSAQSVANVLWAAATLQLPRVDPNRPQRPRGPAARFFFSPCHRNCVV